MLHAMTDHFITHGHDVTILARDPDKLNALVKNYPEHKNSHVIAQDYTETDDFIASLRHAGPFDIVICWMHSLARDSLSALLELLEAQSHRAQFYHIKGLSYKGLAKDALLKDKNNLDYAEIILGFKIEKGTQRWLTHTEIAQGVVDAVESGSAKSVIGLET